MRFVRAILMIGAAAAMPALANLPTWDNSGNSLLSGTYYFREVLYAVGDNAGDFASAYATFGTITFNGSGGYSIPNGTLTYYQSSSGSGQQAVNTTGTYTFGANGYGFFTNPLSTLGVSITNYGLISNGVLISSSTENGYNTLFIAVPVSTSTVGQATAASFQGNYQLSAFIPGSASTSAGVSFPLNPDGNGNLGTVSMTGYFAGSGATAYTQSSAGVKYTFSNGAGVITLPSNTNANFYTGGTAGQIYLYISPDRNFVFGGSPNGYDMFVGVKTTTGAVNFNGIYYEAGLDFDGTQYASAGFSSLDSYYGSFNAVNGNVIGHERLYYGLYDSLDGLNYTASYPTITNGAYTVTSAPYATQYTFGNGGAIRIGFGVGPSLGLGVALQAPTLTASSSTAAFLNPMGVVNAASYAPFTSGVSPGEIVVLYGSNLAPGFKAATTLPLPITLNGVTVTVNGIAAPFYYVSPTQLSIVIPYGAAYTPTSGLALAQIVVTNNGSGVASNSVTQVINLTTPGVFTQNASGLGLGSIYHATPAGFVAVTNSNPARPGETVVAYISGMGTTVPSVVEGAAAPGSPVANTANNFDININGTEACGTETNVTPCPFVGLAPSLANVYQFNIPIPSTATSGSNSIEIFGPDSDNFQISIPVGTATASSSVIERTESANRAMRSQRLKKPANARPLPCLRVSGATCAATL